MMQGNFNIQISADASQGIAAANATADALKKAADATSQIADESERYQQALEKMAQSQAQVKQVSAEDVAMTERAASRKKDLAERAAYAASVQEELAGSIATVTKEQAEEIIGTEKSVSGKRKLADAAKALGSEFPMLGALGRMALNPIVGITLLAVGAFRALKGAVDDFTASLKDPEMANYQAALRAQKDAAAQAAVEAAKYAEEVFRIATAQTTASEAGERLLSVFRAQMNAEDRMDEARKRVEMARARSEASPEKRAKMEFEIEERYGKRKLEREEKSRQFERTEQYRKLANEEIAARLANERAEAGIRSAAAAKGEQEKVAARLGEEEKVQAKVKQAAQEAMDTQAKWQASSAPGDALKAEAFAPHLEGILRMRDAQNRLVERLRKRLVDAQVKEAGAMSSVDANRAIATGAFQRAEGIRAMLPTQEAVWGVEGQAGRGVYALGRMEAMGETAAGQRVKRAAEIANNVRRGIKVSAGDRAELDAIFKSTYGYAPKGMQAVGLFAGVDNDANRFNALTGRMMTGSQVSEASAAADALRSGRKVSQGQADSIIELARALTGVEQGLSRSAQLVSRLNDSVSQFNGAITAIENRTRRLERQTANLR